MLNLNATIIVAVQGSGMLILYDLD